MRNLMGLSDLERTANLALDSRTLVLDTETTGLYPSADDLLRIAITDIDGNVVFESFVKPARRSEWPEAQRINRISPHMVSRAPLFSEISGEVRGILSSASLIVGYNVDFDLSMLHGNGMGEIGVPTYCLMKEWAKGYGDWAEWKGEPKWMKLSDCAAHYCIEYGAHDPVEDCRATAMCLKLFQAECAQAISEGIWAGSPRMERAVKSARAMLVIQVALAVAVGAAVGWFVGWIVSSIIGIVVGVIAGLLAGLAVAAKLIAQVAARLPNSTR